MSGKSRVIGVIPARYGSTRLAAKVLLEIDGKPMLQHVWERAKQSRSLDELLIATDDERILRAAEKFGARAVMTSPDHPSGTDRIAEAVASLPVEIVVNIQGDEPLIRPAVIDALAQALLDDPACPMATVIKPVADPADVANPNVVKVVVDAKGYALYFSRSPVPYDRAGAGPLAAGYFKHLGIYAYRKNFLLNYKKLPRSRLEELEKLEQLRALEAGHRIKTVVTDAETVSVDVEADLEKVKAILKEGKS